MKKIILCLVVFLLLMSPIFAEQKLYTPDGQSVLLKDDGTYEFVSQDEHVLFVLQSVESDVSYDNSQLTKIIFRVENYGYGTLYYLYATIKAYDDRGKQYEDYAMSAIDTRGWNTIYIEKNASKTFTVQVKGDKEFLSKVVLNPIKPENFNMRELPEGMDIKNIIKVESAIPNITFSM